MTNMLSKLNERCNAEEDFSFISVMPEYLLGLTNVSRTSIVYASIRGQLSPFCKALVARKGRNQTQKPRDYHLSHTTDMGIRKGGFH